MEYSTVWTKTLFYSLRYVRSVCRQIDNAVSRRAGVITGMNPNCSPEADNTHIQIEKVISLTEKKKKALKLLLICRETMKGLFIPYKKALALRYWYRKTDEDIAAVLGCSLRTVFRYTRDGFTALNTLRKKYGYSDEYLEDFFREEKWIMRQKYKAEDEEAAIIKIINVKKMKKKNAA